MPMMKPKRIDASLRPLAAMLLTAMLLALLPAPALADSLRIQAPEALRPFEVVQLAVCAPEDGLLTVRITDARGAQRPAAERLRVQAGESLVPYDGTSYAGMPLKRGDCRLIAILRGDSGRLYASSLDATVGDPLPVLEYALPYADIYYRGQSGPWLMDCSVTGACVVSLEIYRDQAMTDLAAAVRKKLKNSGIFRIAWSGKRDGRALPEGMYYCKAYASGREGDAFTFPLTLAGGKPPQTELAPTGALLPASLDDQAVWAQMQQPLAVVDIEATKHQRLYSEPDGGAKPVGSVHGQSQGLEIVELGKRYALVRAWRHEDGAPVEGYVPLKKLKLVTPNARYGVLIDKRSQVLTVYEQGKPVGQMRVSTGLPTKDKLFRETRAGAFITTDRVPPFESKGMRYDYAIRIDGGNLIHALGYQAKGSGAGTQLRELGAKASEGCVRADYRTDAQHTLNAYWLWTHLPHGTKVLVIE